MPIPCQRVDARITMPGIVHGSTKHTGSQQRRTVLPWFVGVEGDLEALDNPESESWIELALHHLKLTQPVLTLFGLGERYGTIPRGFPTGT